MRILMTNDLPPGTGGGAEVYLDRLVTALRAAGDEVELFVPARAREGAGRVLDMWDPFSRRRLAAVAQGFRPDVVHHHNVARELSVSVLTADVGAPTVMTVHDGRLAGAPEPNVTGMRGVVDRRIKRPVDVTVARRSVDAVIAVSAPLAARLRAAGFRRVEHVPPPVPAAAGPGSDVTSTRDVLLASRLTPDKGARLLVDAFAAVAPRCPGARLLVAGDGPERAAIAARRVPGVELLGRVDPAGVGALMSRVRVVAVPSTGPEGTPLAALEGARHGRALLLTDAPGLGELAADLGQRPVPAGSVPALAEALEHLLTDDAAATAAATAAAARSHAYDAAAVADRIRSLYADLVDTRRAGAAS